MSEEAKQTVSEWMRLFMPMLLALCLGMFAHVKSVTALEVRQDLGDRRLDDRLSSLTLQVSTLETAGSPMARMNSQRVDFLTERMLKTEATLASNALSIGEMRGDLRLIAEWVKEQKEQKARLGRTDAP